jgi:hypothetical protein
MRMADRSKSLFTLALVLTAMTLAGTAGALGGVESSLTQPVRELGDRLDQLVAAAKPPMFKRHLVSVIGQCT